MGTYMSETDVEARIPDRSITSSTTPNSTQVALFITAAEAKLEGALTAGQIGVPITDSNGIEIMKDWATTYVEGRTRMAFAAAAGDSDNDDGKDMVEWFENTLIPDILTFPQKYEAMLTGGSATQSRHFRSYILDNDDDKTISDGDFDPIFESDEAPEDIF